MAQLETDETAPPESWADASTGELVEGANWWDGAGRELGVRWNADGEHRLAMRRDLPDNWKEMRPASMAQLRRDLVDEAADVNTSVRAHTKRLARISRARRGWALRMANYAGSRNTKIAVKCWRCANILKFRHYTDAGQVRLVGGYFCQQWRICLACAIKRGSNMLRVLAPKIIEQLQARPRAKAYLVTITTKNGPDCKERFDHKRNGLKKYYRQRSQARIFRCVRDKDGNRIRGEDGQWKKERKAPLVEANKAFGIFSAIEGGIGKGSGAWHWHSHAVYLCDEGKVPNAEVLAEEWKKITGDSYIVHVDLFKSCAAGDRSRDAIIKDVLEVCKYTLKPHELTPADAWQANEASAGAHYTKTIGTLRLSKAEAKAIKAKYDEKLSGASHTVFYRWCQRSGIYLEVDDVATANREQMTALRGFNGEPIEDPERDAAARARQALTFTIKHTLRRYVAQHGSRLRARAAAPAVASQLDTRAFLGGAPTPKNARPPPHPPPDHLPRVSAVRIDPRYAVNV